MRFVETTHVMSHIRVGLLYSQGCCNKRHQRHPWHITDMENPIPTFSFSHPSFSEDAVLPGDAANLAWGPDDNTPPGLKLRGFDIQSHGSVLSGEDHQEGAVREKWEVAQPGTKMILAGGP